MSKNARRFAIPAMGLLITYMIVVLAFASAFELISGLAEAAHFNVHGVHRPLEFTEAIHFSFGTITLLGYGDIVPVSRLARGLVAMEIACGVMLLLLGAATVVQEGSRQRELGSAEDTEARDRLQDP